MIKFIFRILWIVAAIAVLVLLTMIFNGNTGTAIVSITVGLMAGLYVSGITSFLNGADYPDNDNLPEQ